MKSKRWKKIGIILAVLLAVVIAAALIVPSFIDLNRYNGLITSKLEAATGGKVTLGPLSWGISTGVWLEADGFALQGATSFPGDVDLSRIYAKVSVLPLLSKKVVIDELLLHSPVVGMNLAPSPEKEKKAKTKPAGTPGSPLPVEILIRELNIKKGRVRFENLPGPQVSRAFKDVEVGARNLAPGKEIGFRLAIRDEARPGLGFLKGQGTFKGLTETLTLENPGLKVRFTLADLNVDALKPYVKDKSLAQRLGGSISLEVNYQGDFGKHFSAHGQVDLTQFTYTGLSKWEQSLPQAETKIAYKLMASPDQIRIEKFSLNLGSISLEGEGMLRDWRRDLIVDAKAKAESLSLADLSSLFPPLKKFELDGILDMNIEVHHLKGQPAESRLNGKVKTSGLGIKLAKLKVTEGNGDIQFAGNRVNLNEINLKVNGQKMTASGLITNFQEPTAQLRVKSPNLNLDRLLPPKAADESSSKSREKSPGKQESKAPGKRAPSEKKAKKAELHPFLKKLTAELQVDADRGTYRGQEFEALKLKALYERGLLKSHHFEVLIGGGRVQTQGSADLRNPEGIPFTIEPDINSVRIESIVAILDTDKIATRGPLTMTGRIQGRSGSTLSLLGSLNGNLEAEAGPGRMYKLGPAGKAFFKVLDFINISQLFSGKKIENLGAEGVPFDSLEAQTSFQEGRMNLKQLVLESPALRLDANGEINLVQKKLTIDADIAALGTLDKVLGIIPIMGKAGQKLTNVHLTVEGNLEDPKIRIRPVKGVTEAGKTGVQKGGEATGEVIKEVGKGLEKIMGK